MKITFMGSAAFAVPSLVALIECGHEIALVVAQPDKPAGRGMHIRHCPVAQFAIESGRPIFQPDKIKTPEAIERIKNSRPELIAVVAYGKILPPEILIIPPRGCVNVHASLLPKYRGAAPINWAIINGDSESGVTTQLMDEKLDTGDILMSCKTQVDEAETAQDLCDRLAGVGADLLIKTISGLVDGSIIPKKQDDSKATFAPILKKEDGHINWSESSRAIFNRVRGLKPWPGTFSFLNGRLLRIHEAAITEMDAGAEPGVVIESGDHLAVACGKGFLYLIEIQPEGGRKMSAKEFLCGHRVKIGDILK